MQFSCNITLSKQFTLQYTWYNMTPTSTNQITLQHNVIQYDTVNTIR